MWFDGTRPRVVGLDAEKGGITRSAEKDAPLQMVRPQVMTMGPASLQGKIIYLGGQPFMLQECSGSDVYCNALIGEPSLDEGANGPAPWKPTYDIADPMT